MAGPLTNCVRTLPLMLHIAHGLTFTWGVYNRLVLNAWFFQTIRFAVSTPTRFPFVSSNLQRDNTNTLSNS